MRQRLGQHFLENNKILEQIAETIDPREGDFIVEIGPGHGELTDKILQKCETFKKCKVIAIEKDKNLVASNRWSGVSNKIEIIEGDALKILPVLHTKYKIQNTRYKLVGNIPYYMTGHLLRIIGELKNKPSETILLIQKEVAERVCAKAPHSNLLSMSVQFWAKSKILFNVPKEDFLPPPKVESAVLKLISINDVKRDKLADRYYSFIKKAFKQPRKTLKNNLISGGIDMPKVEEILSALGLKDNDRPQAMTSEAIIGICRLL
jgi:16S rRNA (adenine1518-N6/adenine1519-N6)-dimethyltransferase